MQVAINLLHVRTLQRGKDTSPMRIGKVQKNDVRGVGGWKNKGEGARGEGREGLQRR